MHRDLLKFPTEKDGYMKRKFKTLKRGLSLKTS